jgi:excisionase family DNA binding protein
MNISPHVDRAEAREFARLKSQLASAERLVVRPAEAERMLGIGHKQLYQLLNNGELESFTVGRSRRIPMASIRAYIARKLEKFPKPKQRRTG